MFCVRSERRLPVSLTVQGRDLLELQIEKCFAAGVWASQQSGVGEGIPLGLREVPPCLIPSDCDVDSESRFTPCLIELRCLHIVRQFLCKLYHHQSSRKHCTNTGSVLGWRVSRWSSNESMFVAISSVNNLPPTSKHDTFTECSFNVGPATNTETTLSRCLVFAGQRESPQWRHFSCGRGETMTISTAEKLADQLLAKSFSVYRPHRAEAIYRLLISLYLLSESSDRQFRL